ncbi:MAG: UPF0182 family protein, partial [Eubacteriales bacterium]|nr:UPF0182 family protein [Eubacteriales bacterium]
GIYIEIIQYREIGGYEGVYLKNLIYKAISSAAVFVVAFAVFGTTAAVVRRNLRAYYRDNEIDASDSGILQLPGNIAVVILSAAAAFFTRNIFHQKILEFFNAVDTGITDPLFGRELGYFLFKRPLVVQAYQLLITLWVLAAIMAAAYYYLAVKATEGYGQSSNLPYIQFRPLLKGRFARHMLICIVGYFALKAVSYIFMKEEILYSGFVAGLTGAGYADAKIWLAYYSFMPFLILACLAAAIFFLSRKKTGKALISLIPMPAAWIITAIVAAVLQSVYIDPNEARIENRYIGYNMSETRHAYNLDSVENIDFDSVQEINAEILQKNIETVRNIRVIDYIPTLDSNIQLQSNTNFYTFYDADILDYTINDISTPVFVSAREIDRNKLPVQSYINTMFKYTHGYGVVMNPINSITREGQAEYIISGLRMNTTDPKLVATRPEIYYGELTRYPVIVNAAQGLKEIDYDGNRETVYEGVSGIKLSFLNRVLFAMKYRDFNLLISGYIDGNSKILLNRYVVERAAKAAPFLMIDPDPFIVLTPEGRLKWVLDGYTYSGRYPYSQYTDWLGTRFNYIRNSVKIIVDAYDGSTEFYIVDEDDPIIAAYEKIYPSLFTGKGFPEDVRQQMKYPEALFKIQTLLLQAYHLDPGDTEEDNVQKFYTNQDRWEIAKYSTYAEYTGNYSSGGGETYIVPYYNMIKLPDGNGETEELILMRPFTPAKKSNLVSWLAVKNSWENYGEMMIFGFPKNTNIFGPSQVEQKINQIDNVSKDMTLWGQSGSRVFKGSLLVIPMETSILYVEPIYIQASGSTSIPEVRKIIVGSQRGNEIRFGTGTTLDEALSQLLGESFSVSEGAGGTTLPGENGEQDGEKPDETPEEGEEDKTDAAMIEELLRKYDMIREQLDEMGKMIRELQ